MTAPVLSIKIRSKSFNQRQVLGPIDFQLDAGERLAILGPSGIGKTTLLRVVSGLDNHFEGEIERPNRISMVFQEPVLLPWRTAAENLEIATGITLRAAEVHLASVGLMGRSAEFPARFSLGEQRRLSLARALAAHPELLILDEPFASLDERTAQSMMELVRRLIEVERMSVLLVTHSRAEASYLCDRVLQLEGNPAILQEYRFP